MTQALAIDVRGLALADKAPVFTGIDLAIPEGALLVLRGPAGAGKTALLLALAGRMKTTGGGGTVLGHDLRREGRAVRARVALAHVTGLTDVDPDLTVEQHIAERLIMIQPWYKPVASRRRVGEVYRVGRTLLEATATRVAELVAPERRDKAPDFAEAFGQKVFVSDLTDLQSFALEVSLAMMSGPEMLAIDNVDVLREAADRRRAWAGLLMLQREFPSLTIVATCEEDGDLLTLRESVADLRRLELQGR